MTLSAADIANATGGVVVGNADTTITHPAKLEAANEESLCFFANPKYENALYQCKAAIVIVPTGFEPSKPTTFTRIEHENPYYAFCLILSGFFDPNNHKVGIEAGSVVMPSAKIGANVYLGATCYIDDDVVIEDGAVIYPQVFVGKGAKVGKNTILYPGVKIYARCIVGNDCIIHGGTVIGSDGFGHAPVGDIYVKIPQIGNVVIEDNVEIGSNCSVDRATMGSTYIRNGVKLDNLIQIAHNAEIGRNTVIAAHTAISGSTKIGANCKIGGQVGVVGHINIADRTGIGAQAGVTKSVDTPNTQWIGSPAAPLKEKFRTWALQRKIPDIMQDIVDLKKEIESLKKDK